ncbi:MAG: hypothetical protein IH872_09145 [Chloroflexi bacterium]|nr:hypothetical protein [Chloroflexota bacterium]
MTGTLLSSGSLIVPEGHVLVRMYDIGFGDCFLLAIPTPDGLKKVLIDCGSIHKRNKTKSEIVKRLIEDVRDDEGVPQIDVVIATHRHSDHVSGFSRRDWENVQVGEVWMPWTEDPEDSEARRIRNAQSSFAVALAGSLGIATALEDPEDALEEDDATGLSSTLALNALSNERAMNTLHHGFKGHPRRRFLPDEDSVVTGFGTASLPGVVVHVLGPSRTEEVIRDMDPPNAQAYFRFQAGVGQNQEIPELFGNYYWDNDDVPLNVLTDADIKTIHSFNDQEENALAIALDKAVNGTSLMLLFVVGNLHLLFPGDAQWGTWKAALEDPVTRRLLEKTNFYKVGHHGSHNATPVEFVEDVLGVGGTGPRSAMVSVRSRSQWEQIPRKPLLENLEARVGAIARSDVTEDQPGFRRDGDWHVEIELPIGAE